MNERVQIDRARAVRIGDVAGTRAATIRAELCIQSPQEFEHGYRTGYLGEPQHPCDAAGYMIGHHTWPLERKSAWFAGFNLGYTEREPGHE
jgi:hypothetical protein